MAKRISLPYRSEGPEPRVAAWVQLARTFEIHHRWMLGMLWPHGLTGPQFDVLATIEFRGGLTQQEIAQNLLVTKGNIALVIKNLERDGLIERRADNEDGRIKRVHLTARGSAKLQSILPSHRAAVRAAWRAMADEDVEALRSLLMKLEASLNAVTNPRSSD